MCTGSGAYGGVEFALRTPDGSDRRRARGRAASRSARATGARGSRASRSGISSRDEHHRPARGPRWARRTARALRQVGAGAAAARAARERGLMCGLSFGNRARRPACALLGTSEGAQAVSATTRGGVCGRRAATARKHARGRAYDESITSCRRAQDYVYRVGSVRGRRVRASDTGRVGSPARARPRGVAKRARHWGARIARFAIWNILSRRASSAGPRAALGAPDGTRA